MRARRRLSFLTALILLVAVAPRAGAEDSASPYVRILLSGLKLTDRADMTLEGRYEADAGNGARIACPDGAAVTVQIREGSLILFCQGLAMDAGKSLTLRRVSRDGSGGGIRFSHKGNLFPGDLTLTVSGGQLRPVLRLTVEEYLPGVVPYEMSDSYPAEALKAQAVCARTYAIRHIRTDRDYDMTDTTSDQVYRGTGGGNTNAARAILETAGVVVTVNGDLASCYYSASNGGQTELPGHVWKGESNAGYAVSEDPWDTANPETPVRRFRIRKDGRDLPGGLLEQLRARIMAQPEMKEWIDSPEAFRVDAVTGAELTEPRYEVPNRLMTKLRLTVKVSGRMLLPAETPMDLIWDDEETEAPEASAAPAPAGTAEETPTPSPAPSPTPAPTPRISDFAAAGTYTVELSVFPELIRALNLSIDGSDNEILTVAEDDGAFVLVSGRYGHGVGLSQRGAQQMAGVGGKTFPEILAFYYPGTKLMKAPGGGPVLPTPDPKLFDTPGPAATPTPRPTLMPVSTEAIPEGAWLASVENIGDDSSLNLRAEPSQASEILMRLYRHQKLLVLEVCEDPLWAHVKTDAAEGYVMLSFLEKAE